MDARGKITRVAARKIYDSRGVETLEVEVYTEGGFGANAAPFGAPGSRGVYEASAYGTIGLDGAVEAVKDEIGSRLVGADACDSAGCDAILKEIDPSPNFDRIGGNTSSAVSIAVARAGAASRGVPLYRMFVEGTPSFPYPLGNIIGGGAHSMGPAPDMQEHLVMPVGASSISEAVRANIMVHEATGKILERADSGFTGGTDDECAWTANLNDLEALEVVAEACGVVTKETGVAFRLGIDVAADRLWDPEKQVYVYEREKMVRTTAEQIDYMESLVDRLGLYYVEDAFQSDDYESFGELTKRVGSRCYVCGDDLLATNVERTAKAVGGQSVNSMILKINQIGTIAGAAETSKFALSKGLGTVISHRSGETADNTIAHLAVAWNCIGIKTGVIGGERLAKLNEFIRIEEQLGKEGTMARLRIPCRP